MNNFGKNIAVWVIISLVLVAIFNVFQGGSSKSQGIVIAYSDFLKRVKIFLRNNIVDNICNLSSK